MRKFFRIIAVAVLVLLCFLSSVFHVNASKNNQTDISKVHRSNVINIKFDESKEVYLRNNTFIASDGSDLSAVNNLLGSKKISSKDRLIRENEHKVKSERDDLSKKLNKHVPILNNYFKIRLNNGNDLNETVNKLDKISYLSEVYADPLPASSPISPDFSTNQTHFLASPTGMGVSNTASYPGVNGEKIQIADVEYSWNVDHEDLSDNRQADSIIANGTPLDPWNNNNHGTAVTGILNGDRNGFGINGIVSNSKLRLVNTNSLNSGWDVASAIYTAKNNLSPGDVMLIEQQSWGPDGHNYVPIEWVPAVYDAIKSATLSGIIVIEPAGNGSENLDDPVFGTSFPQGKEDSGAIIVGAGTACDNSGNHSRLSFSNYGARVNVQGFGECVVTSGYGSLQNLGDPNTLYTNGFSGTSSASALVAGITGSISSSYKYQKNAALTPLQIRNILIQTGTKQYFGTSAGNIGPLPNLKAALDTFTVAKDTTAPTTPTQLIVGLNRYTSTLKWKTSTDNSGSVIYRVYRNGVMIGTTTSLSYINMNLARRTSYSYKIQAIDSTGNLSGFSNSVTIYTK